MPEQTYHSIIAKAPFGFAYHRIVLDEKSVPVDYEFLEVNKAFEQITGLKAKNIIGKTVCSVLPGIRDGKFDWVARYGEVAMLGKEYEFEQYSESLKKWFRVSTSSPEKGYFTTLFTDITTQYELAKIAQTFLTCTPDTIDYQYLIDTACVISGATYGTLNVFDEDGRTFSTMAFSGMTPLVKKIATQFNFQPVHKKWDYDPVRQEKIKLNKTTIFKSLGQLTGSILPSLMVSAINTTFNIAEIVVVKTEKQGKMLGDFTLLFTKENHLLNQAMLETYADMTGLLFDRLTHESKVIEEQSRLEQITSQITDIVWRSDLHLNISFISPSVERILGFTVEQYAKLPISKRYPAHHLESFRQLLKEELAMEKNADVDRERTRIVEVNHLRSDGSIVLLEINVSFIRDNTGKPIGLQGVSRDISERKALERDVQQQSQFRELLMRMSSEFINIPLEKVDETIQHSLENLGNFVNVDRSYCFEYDWEKNVCNNTYEWCREGIEPQLENLQAVPLDMMPDWVTVHKKGEAMVVPDVLALPHGLVREILEPQDIKSVVSVPMMNEGKCIGFVGFDSVKYHRNYSESEIQLLKLFAQMLVNVVLRKETEKQLIEAKERAEESDRLKTAFLTNISHEIRTPMNGIIGFLDLMREPSLKEEDRASYLEIVNKSGERLLNTINSIIELARIESGDMMVERKELDLALFMSYYHDFFSHQAREKGLELKPLVVNVEKEQLFTDQAKLDSILTNLIKNAIKFTERGSIEIGCTQQGTGDYEFYVRDTGKGIKPEKVQAIFDRFVQEDSTYTRHYEGSGLGLSIARAYVEALGGTIRVDSEPGKGSCFYFNIPVFAP